jgi:murein DD-endopeptidase MepM/ murein hydrolase activator NlpD
MTRLFTLFAVSFTVLLFIFLAAQPTVAQPRFQESLPQDEPQGTPQPAAAQPPPQKSLPEDQAQITPPPTEPEVDWANVEMESQGNDYFPHALAPIPVMPAAPQGAAPAPTDPDEESPLLSGIVAPTPTAGEITHVVHAGETLYRIAQRYGISLEQLIAANNIQNPRRLQIGQVLTIPHDGDTLMVALTPVPTTLVVEPAAPGSNDLYVVQRGDNLSRIARRFGVPIQALIDANSLSNPDRINAGQTLTIPGPTANSPPESPTAPQPEVPPESPTAIQPEVPPVPSATQTTAEVTTSPPAGGHPFIWPIPLQDGWLVKGYRYGHTGIDIILPSGTPIRAAAGGTVEFSGWNAYGFGNLVILDHGNGYRTLYAHQSERLVAGEDIVAQGDVIGLVGITGRATHPHLHFGIRQNYGPVNPCDYLPGGCQQ